MMGTVARFISNARAEADTSSATDALLCLQNVSISYKGEIEVVRDVSLTVPQGTIVALLGPNGAGKTSVLRAVSGLLSFHQGRVVRGAITYQGEDITRWTSARVVRAGIAQVMEARRIFGELTVDENLKVGGFTRPVAEARRTYDEVMAFFPALAERRLSPAGYLSGGQQQMVAIGRALMARPKLLLLDEPSLGLAPIVVQQITDVVRRINSSGTCVLLVEQNAAVALALARTACILEHGRVAIQGSAEALRSDPAVRDVYLGMGATGRRSFRKEASR